MHLIMPQMNDPGQEDAHDAAPALTAPRPPANLESSEEEEDSENEAELNHQGGDEDGAEESGGGYEPLPQEDEDHEGENDGSRPPSPEEGEDEDDDVIGRPQRNPDELLAMVEETERARRREELRELATVWSSSSSQEKRDAMALDSVKVEAIRTAMATFTLPPSAIPGWAAEMSEEEWRDLVQKKLLLQSAKK